MCSSLFIAVCLFFYFVLKVFAEFNRITTTNLASDFFDAVDRCTLVTIFKSKKGNVGERLSEMVQQIDSGVSLLPAS